MMYRHVPQFIDRRDAGGRLAQALERFRGRNPLVLALPRGGVPVAFEVAKALGAELDMLMVRKIGAPGHPELGIGAVVDGSDPQTVWNESTLRAIGPTQIYLKSETERQLKEIERRRRVYFGDRPPIPATGRTVIVVDDGVATGGTIRSALRALKRAGASCRVVAVPVAPEDALPMLRAEADEVVCLATPDPFYAVGYHYENFEQTSDEEVRTLMAAARSLGRPEHVERTEAR